ncbi:class I SAM-dependent methyltransferase [Bacillus sp. T3]|uniref:class I SAM-dependent methyltransferase n=1 Tax=Bacillus sp. T3 TaxID=467262 RepID=UPI002981D10D|nr:methyltransferase domain-containing protein [Bacillus sp. T3]
MDFKINVQILDSAKQTVKKNKSNKNLVTRFIVSILYVLWHAIKNAKRALVDKDHRFILLMQLFNYKNVHQTTPLTYMDRYPTIFSACQEYFDGKENLKILSYGCSTGEEVLTLRKYFPNAQIIGADINKRSLEKCRMLPVDEKISFIYSTANEIKKHGKFDAIFCMAVLQRKPNEIDAKGITNLKKIYPFEKFEKQIIELDELVNPQGLLVVHFTQYSFLDTEVASKYNTLGDYNQNDYRAPVFDKNSRLINNPPLQKSIFIKATK